MASSTELKKDVFGGRHAITVFSKKDTTDLPERMIFVKTLRKNYLTQALTRAYIMSRDIDCMVYVGWEWEIYYKWSGLFHAANWFKVKVWVFKIVFDDSL